MIAPPEQIDFSAIPEQPNIRTSPEERAIAMDVLRKAVDSMDPQRTQCLVLMLMGYAHDEIAQIVGLPPSTVQEHLDCAFDRIREVAREGS